jgi:ceramide glucosyltransferase
LAEHGRSRDVLVVADADVDLAEMSLVALAGGLSPRLAARWAPVVERDADTWPDRASRAVLTASLHAFPVLAALDRDLLVGKALAIDTDALARIGGLASLADGEVFERYVRWILVVRAQRPARLASYPLLFAAMPVACVLAIVAAVPGAATLALASRAIVAAVAAHRSGRGLAAVADAPLADLLLLAAFVRACGPARVRWRDRELRLGEGGRVQAPTDAAQHRPRHGIERAHDHALGE